MTDKKKPEPTSMLRFSGPGAEETRDLLLQMKREHFTSEPAEGMLAFLDGVRKIPNCFTLPESGSIVSGQLWTCARTLDETARALKYVENTGGVEKLRYWLVRTGGAFADLSGLAPGAGDGSGDPGASRKRRPKWRKFETALIQYGDGCLTSLLRCCVAYLHDVTAFATPGDTAIWRCPWEHAREAAVRVRCAVTYLGYFVDGIAPFTLHLFDPMPLGVYGPRGPSAPFKTYAPGRVGLYMDAAGLLLQAQTHVGKLDGPGTVQTDAMRALLRAEAGLLAPLKSAAPVLLCGGDPHMSVLAESARAFLDVHRETLDKCAVELEIIARLGRLANHGRHADAGPMAMDGGAVAPDDTPDGRIAEESICEATAEATGIDWITASEATSELELLCGKSSDRDTCRSRVHTLCDRGFLLTNEKGGKEKRISRKSLSAWVKLQKQQLSAKEDRRIKKEREGRMKRKEGLY